MQPETVADVTQLLASWIAATLNSGDVHVRPLAARDTTAPVELRLYRVTPAAAARDARAPLRLNLSYVVSMAQDDGLNEHRLLGELAFAAMAENTYTPEPPPECLGLVAAIGLATRLDRARPQTAIPRVRSPLRLDIGPFRRVEGLLLGPGDIPLPRALVTLLDSGSSAVTGDDGIFRLTAPSFAATSLRLQIETHGEQHIVDALPGPGMTVRVPLEV